MKCNVSFQGGTVVSGSACAGGLLVLFCSGLSWVAETTAGPSFSVDLLKSDYPLLSCSSFHAFS